MTFLAKDISFFLPGIIILLVIVFIIVLVLYLILEFLKRRGRLFRVLDMRLLEIRIPKEIHKEDESKNFRELISVFEQFVSTIASLKEKSAFKKFIYGKPYISLEVALLPAGYISFYIATPRRYLEFITEQIHSFYPDAEVKETQDYTIFNPGDEVALSVIKTAKNSILPIRTYEELQADPLDSILTALNRTKKGNGAAVQLLVQPSDGSLVEKGRNIIKKLYEGKTLNEILGEETVTATVGKIAKGTKETLAPKKKEEMSEMSPPPLSGAQEKIAEIIQKKIEKPTFKVICRVIASGKTKEEANAEISQLEGVFSQFASPLANHPGKVKVFLKKRQVFNYIFRNFEEKHSFLLNTEEIASLFHFPLPISEVPAINWLGAREAAAPVELPKEGILLGINVYRGKEREVRLQKNDRRRHFYMIGQTGTGKTTLFKNMLIQDIENGMGVGIIDPHGDLAEDILGYIPKKRFEDVVIFNPGDTEVPLGLNMLEYKTDEEKDFAVAEMIRIFEKLFPPEVIGPMFEHNMRNAMLTLMADREKPGTICEIPRIFTDPAFVREKLVKVTDPLVRDFWEKEEAKTSEFHKSEKLGYIISKVGRFVENRMMRNIIGQRRSAFDFKEIMDTGKILVVNLSKGKVGEINSALLGMILVTKLQMASMARAQVPEAERRDFYLYIDEFQNFITESIATILSEARKYRLCLNITHQFIGQLSDEIREAVIGNVGTILSFRIGAEDAEFMEKEFEPVFSAQDLINLDFAHGYIRLLVDGAPTRPFSIKTLPPKEGFDSKKKEALLKASQKKYGRPREEVEAEIKEGLRSIPSSEKLETEFGGETRR